jgi:hypothetical protein
VVAVGENIIFVFYWRLAKWSGAVVVGVPETDLYFW